MSNLTLGYLAGTKAIDIYDEYCKEFGWDSSFRGQFAQQKGYLLERPHQKDIAFG